MRTFNVIIAEKICILDVLQSLDTSLLGIQFWCEIRTGFGKTL